MPRKSILEAVHAAKTRRRESADMAENDSMARHFSEFHMVSRISKAVYIIRGWRYGVWRRPRWRDVRHCLLKFCRTMASSSKLSGLTTLLTLYALFGDDARLLLTTKADDSIFDIITSFALAMFAFEIVVCSFGKVGYLLGFFFWLDLLSTMTLLLDISLIAEYCFGDSISLLQREGSSDSSDGSGGGGGGGDEAARAARMSRAGTRAGRIVRLVRLVRLIRLVKLYKKGEKNLANPGYDWGDDDEEGIAESAVSKKLSEMTTRRVIMLVLGILIALPMFTLDMYGSDLADSAQMGVEFLFRRWCDDIKRYRLSDSDILEHEYLTSSSRQTYEDDFILYLYYHNWFCELDHEADNRDQSSGDNLAKLFWLGASPSQSPLCKYMFPRFQDRSPYDWDARWRGAAWSSFQCNLPAEVQSLVVQSWEDMTSCLSGFVKGTSLIASTEPGLSCPDALRFNERLVVYPSMRGEDECEGVTFMLVFDRRSGSRLEAALNLGQTVFVCFLLGFGAMSFSGDANKLVLRPIERMITKLEKIRGDPLQAMNLSDKEEQIPSRYLKERAVSSATIIEEESRMDRFKKKCKCFFGGKSNNEEDEPMETVVLEKTIIKIGKLLALSLGEVGAELLARNMQGSNSSNVNAMIGGCWVNATFAQCRVRNFSDVTEILDEEVSIFVNRVASVVQNVAHDYWGHCCKFASDAFLLIWRTTPQEAPSNDFLVEEYLEMKARRVADLSVLAICRMIATIAKTPTLVEYRGHKRLIARLPNFRIRLGCVLHKGWAIEGCVGSEFKMDACYLGETLEIMDKLVPLPRHLGCSVLLTQPLIEAISPRLGEECRCVDNVFVPMPMGMLPVDPFKIYTYDLNDSAIEVDIGLASGGVTGKAKKKLLAERRKQRIQRASVQQDVLGALDIDTDLLAMRSKYCDEFMIKFAMGFQNYQAGEWENAKDILEDVNTLLGSEDGPSSAILNFMKTSCYQAPLFWKGHRLLEVVDVFPQEPYSFRERPPTPKPKEDNANRGPQQRLKQSPSSGTLVDSQDGMEPSPTLIPGSSMDFYELNPVNSMEEASTLNFDRQTSGRKRGYSVHDKADLDQFRKQATDGRKLRFAW